MSRQEMYSNLKMIHRFLMNRSFPYHSVSVIFRWQDVGYCVYFMENVRHLVTKEVVDYLEMNADSGRNYGVKFSHVFVEDIENVEANVKVGNL